MVRHKGTWVAIAVAGIVALGAGLYWGRTAMEGGARRDASTLLALSLPDTAGKEQSFGQWKGKLLIVNFWATWCEPCVTEMPSLQVFWDRHAGEEIAIIGVNLGEGEARIRAFTERTGTTFPILLDRDGVAKKNWNIRGVPATFVLDGAGRIRYSHVGGLDFSDESIAAEIIHLLPRKSGKKKP
jgi:peroxiredoxin